MAEGILGIPASLDDPALAVLTDEERARLCRDLALDSGVGAEAASVGELVAARMGPAVVNKLVAPIARGVSLPPPPRCPLRSSLPDYVRRSLCRAP
ncbi:MAG: hypothetical protein R2722_05550 [Tessaracoccus sp.]